MSDYEMKEIEICIIYELVADIPLVDLITV